jgi:hypothetical protein
MIRGKLRFQELVNTVTDIFTIMLSYLLAAFIRYKVLDSEPGLNVFSAPYMLIAFTYSIILAVFFCYIRYTKKDNGGSRGYGVLSVNAIGCLFLLAFFYIIGELYFSRLALILFWLISSVLLEAKWLMLDIVYNKRQSRITGNIRVLVVGGGRVAQDYISAVGGDDACNFDIIGFVGDNHGIFFNHKFSDTDTGNDEDPTKRGWLGGFGRFRDVLEGTKPDEVVFALDDDETQHLDELVPIARDMQVKSSIVPSYNRHIPENAMVSMVDGITMVDLSGGDREAHDSTYGFGLAVPLVFLMLLLIIKRFNVGYLNSFGMYEDYRCVIFAVAGFFGYQWADDILRRRRHSNTIAAVTTALAASATVLLYESAYSQWDGMGQSAAMDMVLTLAVIAATWVAKCIIDIISRDGAWNIM